MASKHIRSGRAPKSDGGNRQWSDFWQRREFLHDGHIPNYVPRRVRVILAIFAVLLIGYACSGILWGCMAFFGPGRRSDQAPALIQGIPSILLSLSAICASAAATFKIVDHYDRRNNEHWYDRQGRNLMITAGFLLLLSLFLNFNDFARSYFHGFNSDSRTLTHTAHGWAGTVKFPGAIIGLSGFVGFILLMFDYFVVRKGERVATRLGLFAFGLICIAGAFTFLNQALEALQSLSVKVVTASEGRTWISARQQAGALNSVILFRILFGLFAGTCGGYLIYRAFTFEDPKDWT